MTIEQTLEQLVISKETLRKLFGKGTEVTRKQLNKLIKQHTIHNTLYTLIRYDVIIINYDIFGDCHYYIS